MKPISTKGVVISILICALGAGLMAQKLLSYRHQLFSIVVNEKWESHLAQNNVFEDSPVVLFGDSQISRWPMALCFGILPVLNRGLSGDKTPAALNRFSDDVLTENPSLVFILLGTNDLAQGLSPKSIVKNLEDMVIQSDKVEALVVFSLLPARGDSLQKRGGKEAIENLNQEIKLLTQGYDNVDYIDLYPLFADEFGLLGREYTDDGLHLNQRAYIKLTCQILPIMKDHIIRSNEESIKTDG